MLFFPLSFQLQAAKLEETDGSGLLCGAMAGVTATVLFFLIMGWAIQHQACGCQMGFTSL